MAPPDDIAFRRRCFLTSDERHGRTIFPKPRKSPAAKGLPFAGAKDGAPGGRRCERHQHLQTKRGVVFRPAVEPRRLRLFRELRVRDPASFMGCSRVPHIVEALLSPIVAKVGRANLSLFEHSPEFLLLGRRCPVILRDRAGDSSVYKRINSNRCRSS